MNGVTLIEDLDYIEGGYARSGQLEPKPYYPRIAGNQPQQQQPHPQYIMDPNPIPMQTQHKSCTIDDIPLDDLLQFISENPLVKKMFQIDIRPYIIIIALLSVLVAYLVKKHFFDEDHSSNNAYMGDII